MRLLVTGIGDAFTSRYFGSSAVVEGPEGLVLLDCPDLIHRALREAREASGWDVNADAIDDIILTHLHGDHCNGLESFGFLRRMHRDGADMGARPRLHTSRPVADRLWERLAPAMDAPFSGEAYESSLEDFFDVRCLPFKSAATVAGLAVRCRFTRHPVPTIGLLISDGNVTLGWSGDTAFDPEHIRWLQEADVIMHETNPGVAVHTPIEKLNALPDELRSRMRLYHVADDFDPASTDIKVLEQGEVIEVC